MDIERLSCVVDYQCRLIMQRYSRQRYITKSGKVLKEKMERRDSTFVCVQNPHAQLQVSRVDRSRSLQIIQFLSFKTVFIHPSLHSYLLFVS